MRGGIFLLLLLLLFQVNTDGGGGWAFLPNQSECQLSCKNGGVCAFDTSRPTVHKCICFIGMFRGDECEKPVETTTVVPETLATSIDDDVSSEETMADTKGAMEERPTEGRHHQPDVSYETELLNAGNEDEDSRDEYMERVTVAIPVIVDSSGQNFAETNPNIKKYEDTLSRTTVSHQQRTTEPNPVAVAAWEKRPQRKGKKLTTTAAPQFEEAEEEQTVRRDQKRKKNRKEGPGERGQVAAVEVDDDSGEGGGWMMAKRRSAKSASSAAAAKRPPSPATAPGSFLFHAVVLLLAPLCSIYSQSFLPNSLSSRLF